MQLPEIDFGSLDYREIGSWPFVLRAVVIGVNVVAAMALVYFLIFSGQLANLAAAEKQVEDKYKEFKDQYTAAVNLDAYKEQMKDMQSTYQDYINELPASSNIPELIDELSKVGEKDGLKFNSIKIGDPKLTAGFYMALPLSINVTGGYHNFGLFMADLSKLARIVTIEDFNIKSGEGALGSTPNSLILDLSATTYWLASASEIQAQTPAATPAKGGAAATPTPAAAPGAPRPRTGGGAARKGAPAKSNAGAE